MKRKAYKAMQMDIHYIKDGVMGGGADVYNRYSGDTRPNAVNRVYEVLKEFRPPDVLKTIFNMLTSDDVVYRVRVAKDGDVEVLRLGFDNVDDPDCGVYISTDTLPSWIQDKIAVLSMLSATPPTEDVPGVGRRIHPQVYWIYKS